MKKSVLNLLSIVVFAFAASIFFAISANAEVVSDTEQVFVKQTDLGRTYLITLQNNGSEEVTLKPIERSVTKQGDGFTDSDTNNEYLDFESNEIKIKSGESYEFETRLKLSTEYTENFPALLFTDSEGTIMSRTDFILQNFKGEAKLEFNVKLNKAGIVMSKDLKITGTVKNVGTQYFIPDGSVVIFKESQAVADFDLLEKLDGVLFPGESREFEIDWSNNLMGTTGTGSYTVKTVITADLLEESQISEIGFYYLPKAALVYLIPLVATVIIAIVLFETGSFGKMYKKLVSIKNSRSK